MSFQQIITLCVCFSLLSCGTLKLPIQAPEPTQPFAGYWVVVNPPKWSAMCLSFHDVHNGKGTMGSSKGDYSLDVPRYTLELDTTAKTFTITPTHESVKKDPILKGTYTFEELYKAIILKDEQGEFIYTLVSFHSFKRGGNIFQKLFNMEEIVFPPCAI